MANQTNKATQLRVANEVRMRQALRKNHWETQGRKCAFCKLDVKLDKAVLHHLTPRSEGGETEEKNTVTACSKCSRARNKGAGQQGATLVEILIVFAVVAIVCGALFGGLTPYCTASTVSGHANQYARAYARRFISDGPVTVDCSGEDTDHNGYVTCSVSQGMGQPVRQIECPSNVVVEANVTCKERIAVTVQQPVQ